MVRTPLASLTLIALFALPAVALAQNYDAMIRQGMQNMDRIVNQANQQANQIVQQRMRDPQVQASYNQYLARMRTSGQRPMDYPTYTYYYVYTNGFSQQGMAHMRANEANISNAERAKVQQLRQAEAQRGQAQSQWQQGYSRNQQEAGRGLMGQSTYYAPNGQPMQLPHTWQPNSTHVHQNNTYHVDQSGRYFVRGADGWWYPLAQR